MAIVNVEKDDLKRAIAKMGGITLNGNGHQAAGLWGAMAKDCHADKSCNFVPGVGLLFKVEGGRPVDTICSWLVELDYLRSDDLNDFCEALRRQLSGVSVWSQQKSDYGQEAVIEYGHYPEYDLIPDMDVDSEECDVRERTEEEEDMFGDIIAFLMGSQDEISPNENSDELTDIQNCDELQNLSRTPIPATNYRQANKTMARIDERGGTNAGVKGGRMKMTRAEIIKEKLSRASPESKQRIIESVLTVLTRHELRSGKDLSAIKQDMEEAVDDG